MMALLYIETGLPQNAAHAVLRQPQVITILSDTLDRCGIRPCGHRSSRISFLGIWR